MSAMPEPFSPSEPGPSAGDEWVWYSRTVWTIFASGPGVLVWIIPTDRHGFGRRLGDGVDNRIFHQRLKSVGHAQGVHGDDQVVGADFRGLRRSCTAGDPAIWVIITPASHQQYVSLKSKCLGGPRGVSQSFETVHNGNEYLVIDAFAREAEDDDWTDHN